MKIKGKLLFLSNTLVLIILLLGGFLIYSSMKNLTEENIRKELLSLNEMSFGLIKTMVNNSVSNYLKLEAERSKNLAEYYYQQFQSRKISEKQAQKLILDLLQNRKMGETGFFYIINSSGTFQFHPNTDKIGKNFSGVDYISKQIQFKEGYLEYNDPKTSDKDQIPNKMLYMIYFKPWDWIITACISRNDFNKIVDTQELMKKIITFKPSETGYSYVLDNKGNMISHPALGNFYNAQDTEGHYFIREMLEKKNGEMEFWFKNVADRFPMKKVAFFKYLAELDWVIVSTSYSQDVYKPVNMIKNMMLIIGLIIMSVLFISLFWMSSLLTRPIQKLMGTIQELDAGNLNARADVETSDEIGELSTTFNKMAVSIKDHTENLENKVKERTKELEAAFKEVNDLKIQQDGDYFLTSLLIKPLLVNQAKNDKVKVEFFISQKKKFHFRKREAEIGGDVCIAHSLSLRGRQYTVFANGDAMGKSLQGAGGALVMGVVFNAYISRTKLINQAQNISPEEWLKECYEELHGIFTSFDGSMMISAVVGIVDDETGLLYYFNAEHPWNILYRNGKAQFSEHELAVRKIGTVDLDKGVVIKVLQLEAGDILILGSDGRDDLAIGIDPDSGMKIMNEDETLFLKTVERVGGDLKTIIEEIKKTGEITDDLSLIKLSYRPGEKSIKNQISQKYYDLKEKAKKLFDQSQFNEAAENLEKAIEIYNEEESYEILSLCYKKTGKEEKEIQLLEKASLYFPTNPNFMYRAALLYKKMKNYELAVLFGERYAIFYPDHFNNLINLSDSYRLLKRLEQAKTALRNAEKIDPQNENVFKLKKLLEKETE